MLEAQRPRPTQHAGRKVKPTLPISIRKGAKRQPVPVDLGLATGANRFGRLADVEVGP